METILLFDFTTQDSIIVFWVIFALCIILFLLGLYCLISILIERSFTNKLDDKSNSMRVFIIYLNDNNVTYFNLSNIKLHYMTLSTFYTQFPPADRDRIKDWINSVASKDNSVQDFLETDIYLSRSKKTVFSLLKIISIDKEKSIIHLESYILKFMPAKTSQRKKRLSSIEEVSKALLHSPNRGVTYGIQFYNSSDSKKYQGIPGPLFSQLKNVAMNYVGNGRYLLEMSSSRLILIDTKMISNQSMITLQQNMTAAFNKFLTMNSYANTIKVAFSYIPNREFPRDAPTLTQKASKLAIQAADRKITLLPYDHSQRYSDADKVSQVQDIENVIKRKLMYTFSSIANAKDGSTLGYFSNVLSNDSTLTTLEEIRSLSEKTGKRKSLFSIVTKQFISTFKNQTASMKGEQRLFYDVYMEDYDFLGKTLDGLWGNKVDTEVSNKRVLKNKLVLEFNEKELRNYAEDPDLYEDLNILKDKYELSLILENNNEFALGNEIMKLFDFFVFDLGGVDVKNDERTNFRVMSKAGKLLRYARPIVTRNIFSWSTVELIVKNGINYVSGSAISSEDAMIRPFDKKVLERLEKIADHTI